MKRLRLGLVLAAAGLFTACHDTKNETEIRVMTWNLAVGIDLDAVFTQPTLLDVMKQAEVAWAQKDRSDFAKRALAIAARIDATRPDLIGLQEVAQYLSQTPPDGPPPPYGPGTPASTLSKDFLVLLLDALHARGLDYALATDGTTPGVVTNADVEVTGADAGGAPTADYRVVDREAVLVRGGVQVVAVRKGNYAASIDVPVPGLPTAYRYARGWVAVDAVKDGKRFTFVSTHLDAFDPRVQAQQARELLALVPAGAATIVVGDMNSDPADVAWPSYGILTTGQAKLADTVADVGAAAPSCCYDALCSDPQASLARRVDHVLHTPHFTSWSAALEGGPGSFDATTGLWPSDHAGQFAVVGLE